MAGVEAGPSVAADHDPAKAKVAVGGYVCSPEPVVFHGHLKVTTLKVRNTGDRPVQVGSHFHFFEVNRALEFDRAAAFGQHLNIPAATALRFEPGDEREVKLVPIRRQAKRVRVQQPGRRRDVWRVRRTAESQGADARGAAWISLFAQKAMTAALVSPHFS